jgi:hypothetical protein
VWGQRGRQAAVGEDVTSAGAATTGVEGGDVGASGDGGGASE